MLGMMDIIFNFGINDEVVKGLVEFINNERFVYDLYRRFIQMFFDVVMGIEKNKFEKIFDEVKEKYGVKYDIDLIVEYLKEVVVRYKEFYKVEKGEDFL